MRASGLETPKISAFVVAYNRARILGTCLRALSFVDEVIVVDKSSTDDTRTVAERYATRVETVPWSPTVEDTREYALSLCTHDWILFLDDDECLTAASGPYFRERVTLGEADVFEVPLRHYILGVHDEAAYYWPEHHVRLFRRGAVAFGRTVHGGVHVRSDRRLRIEPESGVFIHHLSHPDVSSWVERTNRYTSRSDRARVADDGPDLAAFAHARLDHWLRGATEGYPAAVALLRATYDIVDRIKTWEEMRGLDGHANFARVCAELDAAYAPRSWLSRLVCRRRPG